MTVKGSVLGIRGINGLTFSALLPAGQPRSCAIKKGATEVAPLFKHSQASPAIGFA